MQRSLPDRQLGFPSRAPGGQARRRAYGGLGDSTLGLTLDPDVIQQYAGLHLMVGGAAGLTKESERGVLRLMVGFEFE